MSNIKPSLHTGRSLRIPIPRNPTVPSRVSDGIRSCIGWYQVVYQMVSGHVSDGIRPCIRWCIRTCRNTMYPNTSRNVDVPEPGSSRYIETRSPAGSNYHQCNQVHQFTCYFTCSFTLSSSDSRSPINTPIGGFFGILYFVSYRGFF